MAQAWPTRRILVFVFSVLLGLIFLSAALGKAHDAPKFSLVVGYLLPFGWGGTRTNTIVAASLIAWEMFLAVSLLAGKRDRLTLVGTFITLAVFTGALAILAKDAAAPKCGCLGLAQMISNEGSRADVGIVRNVALLWIVGWLFVATRGTPLKAEPKTTEAIPLARGFSIVELMVVIVVIAILISLSLPALFQARYSAKEIKVLSTHRQLLASLNLYALDFDDAHPYIATRGDFYGLLRVHGVPVGRGYFVTSASRWAGVILPTYFSGPRSEIERRSTREYLASVEEPDFVIASHFFLSHSVMADHRYWREIPGYTGLPADPAYLHATMMSDTAFPGQKGLLLETLLGDSSGKGFDRRWSAGMADGSARFFTGADFNERYLVDRWNAGAWGFPVMSTRDGLKGVDF